MYEEPPGEDDPHEQRQTVRSQGVRQVREASIRRDGPADGGHQPCHEAERAQPVRHPLVEEERNAVAEHDQPPATLPR